jgi:hypothetical protein
MIRLWVDVVTGMELDEATSEIRLLDAKAWKARQQRIHDAGFSPLPKT